MTEVFIGFSCVLQSIIIIILHDQATNEKIMYKFSEIFITQDSCMLKTLDSISFINANTICIYLLSPHLFVDKLFISL